MFTVPKVPMEMNNPEPMFRTVGVIFQVKATLKPSTPTSLFGVLRQKGLLFNHPSSCDTYITVLSSTKISQP